MVRSICKEINLRKNYFLEKTKIQSIYFGGGTPSLLNNIQIELLLETVYQNFEVIESPEITLEANPDDINLKKLKDWKTLGINRLSVGVQTFQDSLLKKLNRAHNSFQAEEALKNIKKVGFDNFNLDLIYALPSMTLEGLENDLQKILTYETPHIAIYGLTIEEKTVFGNWYKKGKLKALEEEAQANQFEMIINTLQKNAYEQYEISNFAKNQLYAKHNLGYWQNITCLGVGPSAHSYNGKNRHYSLSNNAIYQKKLQMDELPLFEEILTNKERLNEYLMTSLRTKWGCDLNKIQEVFGIDFLNFYQKIIKQYFKENYLILKNNNLLLTEKGKLLADEILKNLFFV